MPTPVSTTFVDYTTAIRADWLNWVNYVVNTPAGLSGGVSLLTADLTLYVSTTGNDTTGDGSLATPFLTGNRAYQEACKYQLSGDFHIVIQLGNGVFDSVICTGVVAGSGGALATGIYKPGITIKGMGAASTTVQHLPGAALGGAIGAQGGANIQVESLKVLGGNGLVASDGAILTVGPGVEFGTCVNYQMYALEHGTIYRYHDYTVSGGARKHMGTWGSGLIEGGGCTVTFTGAPAFPIAFAGAEVGGMVYDTGTTWAGTAAAVTGARFFAGQGGVIITEDSGPSYFPGNAVGILASGGRYDSYTTQPTLLQGNLTLYVATTGNDTTGTGAVGAPFRTLQHAVEKAKEYHNGQYTITIQMADGTYPETVGVCGFTASDLDANGLHILGNIANPQNVVINSLWVWMSQVTINGIKAIASEISVEAGYLEVRNTIGNKFIVYDGGHLDLFDGSVLSGSGTQAFVGETNSLIRVVGTLTVVGTPAYSSEFIFLKGGGSCFKLIGTITGAATGRRFRAMNNATIDTNNTTTLTYLPGDVAGVLTSGGMYDDYVEYDLTAKTTPVDADYVEITDSAASNARKNVTWANLKATLKTYFDTLYATASQPLDVMAFYPGVPTSSAKVLRVPVARAIAFPANFAGSYGKAGTAATASTAFDVQKNGSSIGTITFGVAGTTATFTTTSGTAKSLAAGDILSIIAPASADATLADVGFALTGTR